METNGLTDGQTDGGDCITSLVSAVGNQHYNLLANLGRERKGPRGKEKSGYERKGVQTKWVEGQQRMGGCLLYTSPSPRDS